MSVCPVCGDNGVDRPLERRGEYTMRRCAVCDVVFSDPMYGADSGCYREAEAHIDYWTHEPGLSWHHRQFLAGGTIYGRRLLDVGCGTGEFLAAARDKGYEVWGLDFVAEKVEVARKRRGLENVYMMNVTQLRDTLVGKGFDVATCFEVLEHLEDPVGFIEQLKGVMNPGAYLAVSVPNRDRTVRASGNEDDPPHHLTRWSLKSLEGFLERSGFIVTGRAVKRLDLAGYLMAKTGYAFIAGLARPLSALIKLLPFKGRGIYVISKLSNL